MPETQQSESSHFMEVRLMPGDQVGRLIDSAAVMIRSYSTALRPSSVEFLYDDLGHLTGTRFHVESTTSPVVSPPKTEPTTTRIKREPRVKTSTNPSSGEPTQPRVRTGSSRQLERFIATLPKPTSRPDLKGTRWSSVKLEEWLPIRDTPGGRQARSKALTPLSRAGVLTVGQLRNMRVSELLALPQLGASSVRYLAERLSWDGLHFKPEPKVKTAKAS